MNVGLRRSSRLMLGCAAIASTTMLAALPASATTAPETTHVRVGSASASASTMTRYVAVDQGFYENEGLDVEVIPFDGGPGELQGLITGQIDIFAGGFAALLGLYESPDQPVVFHEINSAPSYVIYGAEGSDSWEALSESGGVLGVSSVGGQDQHVAMYLARQAGVDADTLNFQASGSPSQRVEGLRSGQLSAVIATDIYAALLDEEGFGVIDRLADHLDRYPTSLMATTRAYLDEHPDTVAALTRADDAAAAWIADNPDEALDILLDGIDADDSERPYYEASMPELVAGVVTDGFSREGYELLVNGAIEEGQLDASVSPDEVVDSFLVEVS